MLAASVRAFIVVYGGLALLAPLFAFLEAKRPATALRRSKRAIAIDLAYWIVTPIFSGTLSRLLTLGVVAAVGLAAGFGTDGEALLLHVSRAAPLGSAPAFVAIPLALVLGDAVAYASHRLRHTRALWPMHSVHHATEELTALGAARLHPLDEALDGVLIGVALLFAGASPTVFAWLAPVSLLHTLLLHANLDWTFGPLGKVLASPRFHRRHHARDLPPANFGGVLALWDLAFGTFDMPAQDAAPFGVTEPSPPGVGGQLLHPFRQWIDAWSRWTQR
ncbi:MAG: sterol desaturase family protein [Polyangiaceae bacterium]